MALDNTCSCSAELGGLGRSRACVQGSLSITTSRIRNGQEAGPWLAQGISAWLAPGISAWLPPGISAWLARGISAWRRRVEKKKIDGRLTAQWGREVQKQEEDLDRGFQQGSGDDAAAQKVGGFGVQPGVWSGCSTPKSPAWGVLAGGPGGVPAEVTRSSSELGELGRGLIKSTDMSIVDVSR